jgi:Ras-related protein Rab-8A
MTDQKSLISSVLYIQLDDQIGPNPIVCIPRDFTTVNKMHVSIKVVTVLSGEHGKVPESLVILPFPSLKLKGIIKYLKWEDSKRRGGIGQAAIAVLFEDVNDVVFYKYFEQLSTLFKEIGLKFKNLELEKGKLEEYETEVKNVNLKIKTLLNELKIEETLKPTEFPKLSLKDSTMIDYKFKIIVLGDPGVGKTSLILRYTNNAFRRSYIPTLGVHVSDKIFKINDVVVQLVIWDLAGQQKFDTMRHQFYMGSDAFILVFDLTDLKSFENISNWFLDIQNQVKEQENLIGCIIGNKSDLEEQVKIKFENAKELSSYLNLNFFETSALSGSNVDNVFTQLAQSLYDLFTEM